jgi:hypothetical protein
MFEYYLAFLATTIILLELLVSGFESQSPKNRTDLNPAFFNNPDISFRL